MLRGSHIYTIPQSQRYIHTVRLYERVKYMCKYNFPNEVYEMLAFCFSSRAVQIQRLTHARNLSPNVTCAFLCAELSIGYKKSGVQNMHK